jgi:hypothetical protein
MRPDGIAALLATTPDRCVVLQRRAALDDQENRETH